MGVDTSLYKENYYVGSSLETLGVHLSQAIKKGARIYNCLAVEDVLIYQNEVSGVVINWSAVEMAKLHVDPMTVRSSYVVDATGHAAEVAQVVSQKSGEKLFTPTGGVIGEKPMWAQEGEKAILENTKEVFPPSLCVRYGCP